MFRTPDGLAVGEEHPGPKRKVADSEKEFFRRCELEHLASVGAIQFLECQKRFWLHAPGGERVARFVVDFSYVVNGVRVVEDVKPWCKRKGDFRLSELYKLKKRWLKAEYGIDVREV